MTQQEANKARVNYQCGGKLKGFQRQKKGTSIWQVVIQM
jgi:hypothetical protein